MAYEYDENMFLNNCIRCNHPVENKGEDDVYCTNCGSRTRNVCSTFLNSGMNNSCNSETVYLKPEDCYCPKCGSLSAFQEEGLINCEYPKVEIEDNRPLKREDLPF